MITCIFENGNKANPALRHVVIDSLIVEDNKILLVKRAMHLMNGGKYALAGGYVEPEESTREAVIREAREETGYLVEPLFLLRIADNPNRPKEDRQNVAFVYVSKPLKKVGEKDEESTEVTWFALDNLPASEDFAFDHYEDIQLYCKYQKEKFPLPVIGEAVPI